MAGGKQAVRRQDRVIGGWVHDKKAESKGDSESARGPLSYEVDPERPASLFVRKRLVKRPKADC
jgi:hypothetical protein